MNQSVYKSIIQSINQSISLIFNQPIDQQIFLPSLRQVSFRHKDQNYHGSHIESLNDQTDNLTKFNFSEMKK